MTSQEALFYETPEEALTAVVTAAGGFKAVGHRIRPDLPVDQAGNWLRDCLNPRKRDKLSPGQLLMLLVEGRQYGCHAAMRFFGEGAGYAVTPLDPQDERAALERRLIESVGELRHIEARLARLLQTPAAVTPLRSA